MLINFDNYDFVIEIMKNVANVELYRNVASILISMYEIMYEIYQENIASEPCFR